MPRPLSHYCYATCRLLGGHRSYLARELSMLRHHNGAPVAVLYGAHSVCGSTGAESQQQQQQRGGQRQQQPSPQSNSSAARLCWKNVARGAAGQGPVVAFNLLRADGSFVGYRCAAGVPQPWCVADFARLCAACYSPLQGA